MAKRTQSVSDYPDEMLLVDDSLCDLLQGLCYCKVRSIPDGPNLSKKILGTQVVIDKQVWYMCIHSGNNEGGIRDVIRQLLVLFEDPHYQLMYHHTLKEMVRNTLFNI